MLRAPGRTGTPTNPCGATPAWWRMALIFPGEPARTLENAEELVERFTKNQLEDARTFEEKSAEQLGPASQGAVRLNTRGPHGSEDDQTARRVGARNPQACGNWSIDR
jgi:hypothetical protein